ncbi:MAG: MFS transporter [Thermoplasmata archaeon]
MSAGDAPIEPDHPPSSASPTRLFRSRSYRGLWTGTFASSLGASVAGVTFAWLVFSSTHNALAVTVLGVSNFVPSLSIGLIAGALADRYERRRLMIVADVVRAGAVGLLALSLVLLGFSLLLTLVVVLVVSAMGALFRPASNALLPQILPGDDLADANGLLLTGMTGGAFFGSAVAGLLIVTVGVASDFSLNALTYVVSAAMVAFVVLPPVRRTSAPAARDRLSLLAEVREGLAYVRGVPALLYTILASLVANFFLAFFFIYLVIFVPEVLHGDSVVFGLLVAANSIGYGIGALAVGRLGAVRHTGLVYIFGWAVVGLLIVELPLVPSSAAALASVSAIGVLSGIANTTYTACVQRTVPGELLGRFFSIDEVGSFAVIPLGQVAGGLLIVSVGISPVFLLAGAGTAASAIVLLFSREARRLAYPPRTTAPVRPKT